MPLTMALVSAVYFVIAASFYFEQCSFMNVCRSFRRKMFLHDMGKQKKYQSEAGNRVEICRDRRDWRSCKIFVSCVDFFRKQCSFLHILQVYTQNLHILLNFSRKRANLLIMRHFRCLLLAKIVSIHAFSVCKILAPENWVV